MWFSSNSHPFVAQVIASVGNYLESLGLVFFVKRYHPATAAVLPS
jgi:hypothetical protein